MICEATSVFKSENLPTDPCVLRLLSLTIEGQLIDLYFGFKLYFDFCDKDIFVSSPNLGSGPREHSLLLTCLCAVGLPSGAILSLPKALLDPRRPEIPTEQSR